MHGQEFHTSYWGHLGLLNLTQHFLLPGYSAYPATAAASLYPANANVADMAHEQHGLVGYVHPYDSIPDPVKDSSVAHELPVDLALGKVDYIEVMGFAEHKSTANVWYRLLNCGFHLPTAAGTDAMANFASLRGPVGLNRVYAKVPAGPLNIDNWLDSIKAWPHLLRRTGLCWDSLFRGKQLGDELSLLAGENKVKFTAWLRSFVPIDHLQIICNGDVVRDLKLDGDGETANVEDAIPISRSGWCLLRAWSEKAEHPILDMYPYATTSPIYVTVAGSHPKSVEDVAYFVAWIDRMIDAAKANQDWNTEAEKRAVLGDAVVRAEKFMCRSENKKLLDLPRPVSPKERERRGRGTLFQPLTTGVPLEPGLGLCAFQLQERFFALYSPAVAAHLSSFPDDTVTRNRDSNRVCGTGLGDGPGCRGLADGPRDLFMGQRRCSERYGLQLGPHSTLERRRLNVEWQECADLCVRASVEAVCLSMFGASQRRRDVVRRTEIHAAGRVRVRRPSPRTG